MAKRTKQDTRVKPPFSPAFTPTQTYIKHANTHAHTTHVHTENKSRPDVFMAECPAQVSTLWVSTGEAERGACQPSNLKNSLTPRQCSSWTFTVANHLPITKASSGSQLPLPNTGRHFHRTCAEQPHSLNTQSLRSRFLEAVFPHCKKRGPRHLHAIL